MINAQWRRSLNCIAFQGGAPERGKITNKRYGALSQAKACTPTLK